VRASCIEFCRVRRLPSATADARNVQVDVIGAEAGQDIVARCPPGWEACVRSTSFGRDVVPEVE
jgi:hypothetical protein